MTGSEILAGESVTTTNDRKTTSAHLRKSCHYVEVEWLTNGTGLLGTVEHRNLLHRLGNSCNKILCRERTIQSDLQHTDFFTLLIEVVGCPFECIESTTHGNDDTIGIGSSHIVEDVVLSSGDLRNLVHVLLNDCGNCIVVLVHRLTSLEVDIFVLRSEEHTSELQS